MKKYLFNQDLLGAILNAGYNAPSGSYVREVYKLSTTSSWLMSPAETKRLNKFVEKVLAAIAKSYQIVEETAAEQNAVAEFIWPEAEDGDFTVNVFTTAQWRNRPSRALPVHAIRVSGLGMQSLADPADAAKIVGERLKKAIGKAELSVEAVPRKDGTLVFSLVPTPKVDNPRYYSAAKWPIWVESPVTADDRNVLMIGRTGKAKIVAASAAVEAGLMYYSVNQSTLAGADWLENDVKAIAQSLPDRLLAARETYYREVRARMRSNLASTENKPKVRTAAEKAKAIEEFEKHRLARKKKLEESLQGKQAISLLPMTNHGFASSRRWGIEIESGGARGIDAPAGWKRKGDGSLRSAWDGHREETGQMVTRQNHVTYVDPSSCPTGVNHTHELYDYSRGWSRNPDYDPNCNQCGDIYEEVTEPEVIIHRYQSDDCAEFVSPILGSMHSKGLEKLLSQIILQPQNDTAGVHVHVEASDLSPRQLGSLVYGYDMVEGLIESSYRRTRRNYAKYRDTKQTMAILSSAKKAAKSVNVERGERYTTLNLQALDQHGTVEFRAMGNVYEYDHLIRWAMFCREIVNLAKAGVSVKEWNSVNSWADLTALFAKYGKEYIRAVMDTMGEEVPSAPRLDTHDGTISMPTGSEKSAEKIVTKRSTLDELAATMDSVAVNSRWKNTVESSLAAIGEGSQRVLVGALASGNTEV